MWTTTATTMIVALRTEGMRLEGIYCSCMVQMDPDLHWKLHQKRQHSALLLISHNFLRWLKTFCRP